MAADANAGKTRGERRAPELENDIVQAPLVGTHRGLAGQRDRRFGAGLEAEPACQFASVWRGKREVDVRSTIGAGCFERAADARVHVSRTHYEIERCARLQHDRLEHAGAQLRSERMTKQCAAHAGVQCLARGQLDCQLIEAEFNGTAAIDIAVAEAAAFDFKPNVQAANQLAALVALRRQFEIEPSQVSADASHAQHEFRQAAQVGIPRAQCEPECWRIRICVDIGGARQCDAGDRCLYGRLQHPVLELDLQANVLHVPREAQPASDTQSEVGVRAVQLLEVERRGGKAAIEFGKAARRLGIFLCGFFAKEWAQVEGWQDQ